MKKNCIPEWNGWNEYFNFWDEFVKGWFDCKANDPNALPEDLLTNCLRPLFDVPNENLRLSEDELPEPYCIDPSHVGIGENFDPNKIGLVVIQMNPGAANQGDGADLEATKYYRNKDSDKGFLIRDFADEKTCNKMFSRWVERWSFFKTKYPQVGSVPPDASETSGVPAHMVCGHDWWNNRNRENWFKSFAGCDLCQVFALETIPYHSRGFDLAKSFKNNEFKEYFLRRVLLPAGICAQTSSSNPLKVVVCCGDKLRKFLGKFKYASKIFNWEYGDGLSVEEKYRDVLERCWPKNAEGKYVKKWYELYCCEIPYCEDGKCKRCKFFALSIYANSMRFPGVNFGVVEKLLKKRISEEVARDSEHAPLYNAMDESAVKSLADSLFEQLPGDDVNRLAPKLGTAAELQTQVFAGKEGVRCQMAFWDSLFDVYPFSKTIFRKQNQKHPWVSYGLPVEGVELTFVFNKHSAKIECNVNDKASGVYGCLNAQKQKIEAAVATPLNWEPQCKRGKEGRARVSLLLDGCSVSNDEDWRRVREWFCTYMPVFERAICEALNNRGR